MSISESAYLRLLDSMKEGAGIVSGPLGASDARERAEGFRHLTRLLSLGLEMILEKGDRARPVFTRWINPYRKLLGDNPWTYYDAALLDAGRAYRIHGRRGGPTYMGVCVYGQGDAGERLIIGNLDDSEMEFSADGSFEIFLAPERPEGAANWIAMSPQSTDVMVRQYFLDIDEQVDAVYEIEALEDAGCPPALAEEEVAARFDAVGRFVLDMLQIETTISALSRTSTPTQLRDGDSYDETAAGEDPPIDLSWVMKAMPTPAILYTGKWVNDLADDEAFVIEGKAPRARYWSVQFLSRWMESPDYRYHEVMFSRRNTVLDAEGRFRVIIAHEDPGADNWLQTTGLASGNVTVRAVKSEDEDLEIDFRRVKLPL